MSLVPYTTQIGLRAPTQSSQNALKVVLVYTDKMTERQSSLMKECQELLCQYLGILVRQASELDTLDPKMKYFVIPSAREELVRKIRSRFEKSILYLPRAVIEARRHYKVNLPARNLAISLTMHNCRVFLVKSCDQPSIRNKINEMCGTIVTSFNDNNPNVVITDRADNKYCSKAFKKNIPVVSRDWLDENFNTANEEEDSFFYFDALSNIREHQIKPFYGLYFKIVVKNSGPIIKSLITENQGNIVYGNENCLTHIVGGANQGTDCSDNVDSSNKGVPDCPKKIDVEFLKTCAEMGYYIGKREYSELRLSARALIKQERVSPAPITNCGNEVDTLPTNEYDTPSENQTMPPPSVPRSLKQPDNMNDLMILKALTTFEPTQTQRASTQMRRLPDPELRIEQTYEPSQQLYWNDSVSRRS